MGSLFNRHIPHELKQRKLGGGYLDFSPRAPFECIAHNIRTILMSPSSLPGRFVGLGTIKQDSQNINFGSGDDLQASSMIVDQFADSQSIYSVTPLYQHANVRHLSLKPSSYIEDSLLLY